MHRHDPAAINVNGVHADTTVAWDAPSRTPLTATHKKSRHPERGCLNCNNWSMMVHILFRSLCHEKEVGTRNKNCVSELISLES